MNLLLLFIITNIILSIYLEYRKFKLATIAHAVTFVVLFSFLALTAGKQYPEINCFFENLLGDKAYDTFLAVISGNNSLQALILTPIIAIEISVIITALISVILLMVKLLNFVKRCKKRLYETVSPKKKINGRFCLTLCQSERIKIYRLNCVMLC